MFKINLNNHSVIKKLDKNNVAESILNLPKQLMASWEQGKKIKIPSAFGRADNIVFCGMGGSNLASELLKRVFGAQIKVPMVLVRSYNLPAFVSSRTLVIIDSYSGTTEEMFACLAQAQKLKAKIIIITSGGRLEQLAKKNRHVYFKLDPSLNPSGQPRYDVGSQLGATLAIFNKLKIINVSQSDLTAIAAKLVSSSFNLMPNSATDKNFSKQSAEKLQGKSIYVIGAEFLSANAHILANQFNESAKQLASPYKLPELNHHFLEALTYPKHIVKNSVFVFLISPDYNSRILKRIDATKKVLTKKGINFVDISSTAGTALNQSLEILNLGGWTGFYLAMINGVNPAEIPWVNFFKKELGK